MPRKRRKQQNALSLESLEQKVMPTTINLLGSGELQIVGTNGADDVVVSTTNNGMVRVQAQGEQAQFFDGNDVDLITFKGKKGHDRFENNTDIDSEAEGNEGKDTLIGGYANDILKGGGGVDDLRGRSGHDEVRGGGGADELRGHGGEDSMYGGGGDDNMWGGGDVDHMVGEDGNDTMRGGAGEDWMWGGDGDDSMMGGADDDNLFGGEGNDTMSGNQGDDYVSGWTGNDDLFGNDGADSLLGGDGRDELDGGWFDNDQDVLTGGKHRDRFHQYEEAGGGHEDTITDKKFGDKIVMHELFDIVFSSVDGDTDFGKIF